MPVLGTGRPEDSGLTSGLGLSRRSIAIGFIDLNRTRKRSPDDNDCPRRAPRRVCASHQGPPQKLNTPHYYTLSCKSQNHAGLPSPILTTNGWPTNRPNPVSSAHKSRALPGHRGRRGPNRYAHIVATPIIDLSSAPAGCATRFQAVAPCRVFRICERHDHLFHRPHNWPQKRVDHAY